MGQEVGWFVPPTFSPFDGTWPPPPRAPLPPFDPDTTDPNTGAPLPVHKTLNFIGGPPDVKVRRENFCGVWVDGLPPVPGGGHDPRMVCSWFLDRYADDQQDRIIATARACGYTHWTLSWPDSRVFGRSIDQFVQTALKLKASGFFVDVHFFSKDFDPHNPDPASVFPVLDALVAANAIDIGTIAWEMNFVMDPEWVDHMDVLARRAPQLVWCLHFQPGYAHYAYNTGDSPGAFWKRRIAAGIRRLKYQCQPVNGTDSPSSWSAGMSQARGNDVLVRLAPGGAWGTSGVDVDMWETTATWQWNNVQDEAHGDLRGFETMCSPGPMTLAGYGNGARHPDGSAL